MEEKDVSAIRMLGKSSNKVVGAGGRKGREGIVTKQAGYIKLTVE